MNDPEHNLDSILYIFVDPPATLWFIYTLLVYFTLTRILRSALVPTLCVSLIVFTVAMQFNSDYFAVRLAKFYPLFLLGYLTSAYALPLAKRVRFHYLVFPALFLLACAAAKDTFFPSTAYGFFLLSCAGILAGVILAGATARLPLFSWLGYIGKRTLPIYLMHFLPLGLLKLVLPKFMSEVPFIATLAIAACGVALPLLAASIAGKLRMNWLFAPPFFRRKAVSA